MMLVQLSGSFWEAALVDEIRCVFILTGGRSTQILYLKTVT